MYGKEKCKAMLEMWMKAEEVIAIGGQSYEIADRRLTRADLGEIRRQIEFWEKRYATATGKGGIRFERAILG